jgi:hypothetical protein
VRVPCCTSSGREWVCREEGGFGVEMSRLRTDATVPGEHSREEA